MAGYKEYRSVSEFPLHLDQLSREEIEAAYLDLRNTYKSLSISRGQLVRRQVETRESLATINQKLQRLTLTLDKVQAEKDQLQQSLAHSANAQKQLANVRNELEEQVSDLKAQIGATTKLLTDFEAAYEDIKVDNGTVPIWQRLQRLLLAAHRLLTADVQALVAQRKLAGSADESWREKDDPASQGRALRDE